MFESFKDKLYKMSQSKYAPWLGAGAIGLTGLALGSHMGETHAEGTLDDAKEAIKIANQHIETANTNLHDINNINPEYIQRYHTLDKAMLVQQIHDKLPQEIDKIKNMTIDDPEIIRLKQEMMDTVDPEMKEKLARDLHERINQVHEQQDRLYKTLYETLKRNNLSEDPSIKEVISPYKLGSHEKHLWVSGKESDTFKDVNSFIVNTQNKLETLPSTTLNQDDINSFNANYRDQIEKNSKDLLTKGQQNLEINQKILNNKDQIINHDKTVGGAIGGVLGAGVGLYGVHKLKNSENNPYKNKETSEDITAYKIANGTYNSTYNNTPQQQYYLEQKKKEEEKRQAQQPQFTDF